MAPANALSSPCSRPAVWTKGRECGASVHCISKFTARLAHNEMRRGLRCGRNCRPEVVGAQPKPDPVTSSHVPSVYSSSSRLDKQHVQRGSTKRLGSARPAHQRPASALSFSRTPPKSPSHPSQTPTPRHSPHLDSKYAVVARRRPFGRTGRLAKSPPAFLPQ